MRRHLVFCSISTLLAFNVTNAPAHAEPGSAPTVIRAPDSEEKDLKACSSGQADACFLMGNRAAAKHDDAAATKNFTIACNGGHGLACVYLGQNYEKDEAKRPMWLSKSITKFTQRCAGGDAEHCYYLGIGYEQGLGTNEDDAKAVKAYRQACDLHFQFGCTNLAGMHLNGKGTKKDVAAAAALYLESCRANDVHACYWLGKIYDDEMGISKDHSQVQKVGRGDVVAHEVIEKKTVGQSHPGRGAAIKALLMNAKPAALESGCKAGSGVDCYLIGIRHQTGDQQDDRRATDYFRKACEGGSNWGCFALGDAYIHGYGVTQNIAEASRYYLSACQVKGGEADDFEAECKATIERMGL